MINLYTSNITRQNCLKCRFHLEKMFPKFDVIKHLSISSYYLFTANSIKDIEIRVGNYDQTDIQKNTLWSNTDGCTSIQQIPCSKPILGQYVSLQKLSTAADKSITFCEIFIYIEGKFHPFAHITHGNSITNEKL